MTTVSSTARSQPSPSSGEAGERAHPSGDNRFKLLDRTISRFQARGDALIEVLHAAQSIFGFLESDLMIYIARALKLPLRQRDRFSMALRLSRGGGNPVRMGF